MATYLHADQLGSIRMITNTTAKNAGTASYTAYGTRTTTGTTSAFGYAGQYTDTETACNGTTPATTTPPPPSS